MGDLKKRKVYCENQGDLNKIVLTDEEVATIEKLRGYIKKFYEIQLKKQEKDIRR